ncbi:MAG: PD-(D/E)XK nuclease family protein [Acidimicrobiia bacterium]|nr:PD-(D/E)XK nuclease family protein [Acidimicrobiia bacterium]
MAALNPRQREVRDELLLYGQTRPTPDPERVATLRRRAIDELTALGAGMETSDWIRVDKHRLSQAHTCAGYLRARSSEEFAWSIANVRGKVLHRALEGLIMSAYRRTPLELAHAAIDELAEDLDERTPGPFLATLSTGERQDLARDVNDMVVKFVCDWPPVLAGWSPRVESSVKLAFGPIHLQAYYDLALGVPVGDEARTFIVDFKSGWQRADHRLEARFYGLMETVRSRVPPYRVATYYLDSGEYSFDDVDEELLSETLDWLLDGVGRIILARSDEAVTYEPSAACRWCPRRQECDDGQQWLAAFGRHSAA